MKHYSFLYNIATLAIGSVLTIFMSLATGTLPTSTPRDTAAVLATPRAKKACDCCRKMTPEEVASFRQRIETLKKRQGAYQKAAELLRQYGLKEGLRHLKQTHPEITEHLEQFTETDTVTKEQ